MQSDIQITNQADLCRIDIEGTIGIPEQWQFDEPEDRITTYEKFRDALKRISAIESPEVVVEIRSTGGDVNDALLIHDALRSLNARITTRCYGYTASAATIIAQAATEGCREISSNALYLIHTAICSTDGNAAELSGKLDMLQQTDARIAGIYAARSARPAAEFELLMAENNGSGRWLSPQEAVDAGLADKVVDVSQRPATALARNLAQGWQRLLASMGLHATEALPANRPEARQAEEQQELLRRAEAERTRQRIAPTATKPREDPSCSETARSANERAYADDVRRFKN